MTVGHDRDEVEAILASMRAAGNAVEEARAEFARATFGESILYGTRSKLCMALGLDANASGITIVDAVRAVIRERDDRQRERDEARAIVDRCAAALRRTVPEMATRGGPCLPEEVEHAVSSALHFRDEARAERDKVADDLDGLCRTLLSGDTGCIDDAIGAALDLSRRGAR